MNMTGMAIDEKKKYGNHDLFQWNVDVWGKGTREIRGRDG
jgi:hypothetical protein